jgi:hypothetical protein
MHICNETPRRHVTWIRFLFWVIAFIITAFSAVYQRVTGPTYPLRGEVFVAGQEVDYELPRNAETTGDAVVRIDVPATVDGTTVWRRFKTDDPYTETSMVRDEKGLTAHLPAQPMAGKLQYHIVLNDGGKTAMVPPEGATVIRFKGHVPLWAMLPHILFMFLAMLLAARTGLEAIGGLGRLRSHMWGTFAFIIVGGFIFGPLVQHYAFGTWWSGVPLGYDLTDNKTLIALVAWVIALVVIGIRRPVRARERWAAFLAVVVMLGIFMIPHSLYGSELDYSKLETGVPVHEAIGSG